MVTDVRILRILRRGPANGAEIATRLGVTRQAVNLHLKKLVQEGAVVKEGRTRGAVFALASRRSKTARDRQYRTRRRLVNLEEDKVFGEIDTSINLGRKLQKGAWDIAQYAFTEMLNNAIEHSHARECRIEAGLDNYEFRFMVRDFGIGVFASIAKNYGFKTEEEAVGELIKGKTTTMPKGHTGEGIFFTSKAADVLALRSHRFELLYDNRKADVYLGQKRYLRGTEVRFSLSRNSRRRIEKVFAAYAPEEFDYQFQRTRVHVKLFREALVSRSEAKRLLASLDRFKEIVLDFHGVKSLGQGFADEVFRVFRARHPEVKIESQNMNPAVSAMIRHVLDNSK